VEGVAPRVRCTCERGLRVGDHDLRQGDGLRGIDHRAGGTGGEHGGEEVAAVEVGASECDEQLPRLQRARIAHDVGERGVGTAELTAAEARELGECARQAHAGSLASSAATTV